MLSSKLSQKTFNLNRRTESSPTVSMDCNWSAKSSNQEQEIRYGYKRKFGSGTD